MIFFLCIICLVVSVSSFQTSFSKPYVQLRTSLKMNEEAPKEWVGAKKFSMKDRYTETKISSEEISKILPHRFSFSLKEDMICLFTHITYLLQ